MSEDEYKYEYVNNISNCKYAIYAVDANPDDTAFYGKCFIYSKPDGFFYKYWFHVRGRIQVGVGEARSRKKNPLRQSTWLGRGAHPTQRTLGWAYILYTT